LATTKDKKMNIRLAALIIMGVLSLSACSNRFDGMGAGANDPSKAGNYQPNTPEYFVASVGDRVLFAVDQSTLSSEAMSILDKQADWLAQNGEFSALIEGHADEQGTREYNLALGARRASAVQAYLVSRGVADNRLSTVTYGKERPIEICSTEECWSKNRRAVTVVQVGTTS